MSADEIDKPDDNKVVPLEHNEAVAERLREQKRVQTKATQLLKQVIQELDSPFPHPPPTELEETGIPKMVSRIITKEVLKRKDAEFWKEVEVKAEEKSEKKAQEKLEEKIQVEWPRFVEPRVRDLMAKCDENVMGFLRGPWAVLCHSCLRFTMVQFTPREVGLLLEHKFKMVECATLGCKNYFGRQNEIRTDIESLVANYLYRLIL